jgi:hypothetical protein
MLAALVALPALAMATPASAEQASASAPRPHRLLGALPHAAPAPRTSIRALPAAPGNLLYGGGPVLHSNVTYAIFWDPAGKLTASYRSTITKYFADVASDSGKTSNPYGVTAQYTDATGPAAYASTFGGAVIDTTPYPSGCPIASGYTACFNDSQLAAEVRAVVGAQKWPTGLKPIFFVFTPGGVNSCFDSAGTSCASNSFCGYHSDTTLAGQAVLYADQPYGDISGCTAHQYPNGNPADATLDTVSHEHNEVITDPLGNAWADASGNENGDKCSHQFAAALGDPAGGWFNQVINNSHYYVQQEWSNAAGGCVQRAGAQAIFTSSPSPARPGSPVAFDASASMGVNGLASGQSWSFGDGATASGAATTHTYSAPGLYTATLTVSDGAGGSATSTATILVTGTPAPLSDFSLATTPASAVLTAGSSAQVNISTSVAAGATEPVSFGLTGLPPGASAWLSAAKVSSGGQATLSLTTSPSTPPGTYAVVLSGYDGTHVHAATFTLTVKAAGGTGSGTPRGATATGSDGTPTSGAPGACASRQLLGNPGFETGTGAPWVASPGVINAAAAGAPPRSGRWLAWLGGYGAGRAERLSQRVTLPAACPTARIKFWLHVDTARAARSAASDTLRIVLIDRSGGSHRLATFSNSDATAGYQQHSYDISRYRGQKVTILFTATERSLQQTSFVIDDTALVVGPSSGSAAQARARHPKRAPRRHKKH